MKNNFLFLIMAVFTIDGVAQIPNILSSYYTQDNTFTYETIVGKRQRINTPRDLDFNPLTGDLWVVNKETENTGGSTIIISDPGQSNQKSLFKKDQNAWHFMSLPTGIAFGDDGNFGTSTGVYDANHNGGVPFTGPTLWPGDLRIYAEPSGGNGSHIDMLHASPYCMGIAHEKDNVYWVTDANSNDVVRYDFAEDHGPGNADHDDGIVWRYTDIFLTWINEEIPAHLVVDKETEWIYVVDGGGKTIVRFDRNSGTKGGTPRFEQYENLAEYTNVTGVRWEIVTREGLEEPSGIDILDGILVVTDHKTGEIIFYDVTGSMPALELGRLHTEDPGIQGVVIGPEGHLWYVNHTNENVIKIIPENIISNNSQVIDAEFKVYPNPTKDLVLIEKLTSSTVKLYNTSGQLLETRIDQNGAMTIDLEQYESGVYYIDILSSNQKKVYKIMKQ